MRILVLGAGMIGTLVAAKLAEAGHDVRLLARGARLDALRAGPIRLRRQGQSATSDVSVEAVGALGDDGFDWILVTTRGHQVDALLPMLSADTKTPSVMFLVNHAGALDAWADAIGTERLALGFPGLIAYFEDDVLVYQVAPRAFQPTTLGELDGRRSERLVSLAAALEAAGIPATIETDIPAWLKYHVAWISVLGLLAAAANGDANALARDAALRRKGVDAVREGFAVLSALGYRRTPGSLRVFAWTPRWLLAWAIKRMAADPSARRSMEKPSAATRDEARYMAAQMIALSEEAGVPMPSYESLAAHLG